MSRPLDVRDMWVADEASRALGMTLVDAAEGRAVVRMTVRDDMLNGHGTAHGGLVATLADSAFAVACNSHGVAAVASGFDVTFLRPAHVGDVLVATAQERSLNGRTGICDVSVHRPDGEVVAEFRGRSRQLPPR